MQPEHHPGLELPVPDEASAAHCRRVREHIAQLIEECGGSISFAEFMQQALYAPGLGYYVSGTTKFGPDGDFITAPETSPLFGKVLATQIAAVLDQMNGGDVFELGAGSGALAATILRKLAVLNSLPKRYCILEVSADLRQRQEDYLRSEVPEMLALVEWVSELPVAFAGAIVANEVADALPVERFKISDGETLQVGVEVEQDEFQWQETVAPETLGIAVTNIKEQIGGEFPNGYSSEVCMALGPWIRDLVSCLRCGIIFLFDYGVTRREYYAPDRQDGWLRCHYRHRAHNNPLVYPGIQDLTSWVDFSAVAAAAIDSGAEIAGFVSQAHFLINGGLQDELAEFTSLPLEEQLELSRQTKLLTLPGEMGENFKCIGLSRGDVMPPSAFRASDRTHML